jgi:hypothetical protein
MARTAAWKRMRSGVAAAGDVAFEKHRVRVGGVADGFGVVKALEGELEVDAAGFRGGETGDDDVIGRGGEGLAGVGDAAGLVADGSGGGGEIERAGVAEAPSRPGASRKSSPRVW